MVGVNYVTCLTKPIKYINIPDVDVMSWFDHHTGSFTHVPFVQEETLLQPPTVNTIVHEPTCFKHVNVEQRSARYGCDALLTGQYQRNIQFNHYLGFTSGPIVNLCYTNKNSPLDLTGNSVDVVVMETFSYRMSLQFHQN